MPSCSSHVNDKPKGLAGVPACSENPFSRASVTDSPETPGLRSPVLLQGGCGGFKLHILLVCVLGEESPRAANLQSGLESDKPIGLRKKVYREKI
jgi:hypothetical protein